jgi:hypothetical protein
MCIGPPASLTSKSGPPPSARPPIKNAIKVDLPPPGSQYFRITPSLHKYTLCTLYASKKIKKILIIFGEVLIFLPSKKFAISILVQSKGSPRSRTQLSPPGGAKGSPRPPSPDSPRPARLITHSISEYLDRNTEIIKKPIFLLILLFGIFWIILGDLFCVNICFIASGAPARPTVLLLPRYKQKSNIWCRGYKKMVV